MLWYVLQTRTGEEEKMVQMVRQIVPGHLYGECFVVYHEQLWRRQQQNFVHISRAFPGYVFITSKEPEALFFCLKQFPSMVKLMAADDDSFFLSLEAEEAAFLEQVMDIHHVIALSYLEMGSNGKVYRVEGPLKSCVSKIVRCRLKKRYVLVRIKLLGKEKDILLGIILKEDISQGIRYGKVDAPIRYSGMYPTIPIDQRVSKRKETKPQECK